MRRASWLFLLLFVVAASATAGAQSANLVIHGTVVDSTEAPIPGALVTATSDRGSAPALAMTDAGGAFTLPLGAGDTGSASTSTGSATWNSSSPRVRRRPRRPGSCCRSPGCVRR
jgi:hypothetical protein